MADLNVTLGTDGSFELIDLGAADTLSLFVGGGDIVVTGDRGENFVDLSVLPDLLDNEDNDVFAGIISTGRGADEILGSDLGDQIDAGSGSDLVLGLGGDDVIDAGSGADFVDGGDGDDIINGGNGQDILDGGDGDDTIDGGNGRDELNGNAGNDTLNGGVGNDALFGSQGNDILDGGEGRDILEGGSGADKLISGADDANDLLVGGGGRDVFCFETDRSDDSIGRDFIEDFQRNDRIDLRDINRLELVEVNVVNDFTVELNLFGRNDHEIGSIRVEAANSNALRTLFNKNEYGSSGSDNIRADSGVDFEFPESIDTII